MFGNARDPGLEAADAPDDQIDLHTGRTGLVEGADHAGVGEGVHLRADMRGLSGCRCLLHALYLRVEAVAHPQGRDDQAVPVQRLGIAGQHVEDRGGVLAVLLAAGQHAEIRVELCRAVIVVSGAEVHITADAVLLGAHHQGDLRVGLQAQEAVDHVAASLLKHLGPGNVVFLVKAGLQLHQHRDLLAVIGRFGQGLDDGGISADAVQGLLDGQDVRVLRRRLHELHHRVKGLVGMAQQDVALPDVREDAVLVHEGRDRLRDVLRVLQAVKARQAVHLHEHGQIQRPVDPEQVRLLDLQLVAEDLQELLVHGILHLQPDRFAPLAALQLLLDLLHEVGSIFLVQIELRVPHDAEGVRGQDVIVHEELVHVAFDDLFQQDDGGLPCSLLSFFLLSGPGRLRRDHHDPRKDGRHLDDGEIRALLFLVLFLLLFLDPDQGLHILFPADAGRDVQGLVPDQREGAGGIHRHGRQDRVDGVFKILVGEGCLRLRQVLMPADDVQAFLLQRREHRAVQGGVLLLHHGVGPEGDGPELLLRRHAGDVLLCIVRRHLVLQRRHPDHKEFVQVGAYDAQEFQPLKEGRVLVPGLRQHALVEGDPGELAAHIVFRIAEIHRGFRVCSCGVFPARKAYCLCRCRRFRRYRRVRRFFLFFCHIPHLTFRLRMPASGAAPVRFRKFH